MVEVIQHYYGSGILNLLARCRKRYGKESCNICIGLLDKLIRPLIYGKDNLTKRSVSDKR